MAVIQYPQHARMYDVHGLRPGFRLFITVQIQVASAFSCWLCQPLPCSLSAYALPCSLSAYAASVHMHNLRRHHNISVAMHGNTEVVMAPEIVCTG